MKLPKSKFVILLMSLLLLFALVGCGGSNEEPDLPPQKHEQTEKQEELEEQNEEIEEVTEPYVVWHDDEGTDVTVLEEDDPLVVEVKEFIKEFITVSDSYDYRTAKVEENVYPYLCSEALLYEFEEEGWKGVFEEYRQGKVVSESVAVEIQGLIFNKECDVVEASVDITTRIVSATEEFLQENGMSLGEETTSLVMVFRFDPPILENICLMFQLSHGCPLFRPPSLLV
jgi:uncharacterized protein YcfL